MSILSKNLASESPSTKMIKLLYPMPNDEEALDVQLIYPQLVFQEDLELLVLGRTRDARETVLVAADEEEIGEISVLDQLGVVRGRHDLPRRRSVLHHCDHPRDQVGMDVPLRLFDDGHVGPIEVEGRDDRHQDHSTIR